MERYNIDLWRFLKENNERSLDLPERLKMAEKFMEQVGEIKSRIEGHRDLKPSNVLLNVKPENSKWNGDMQITDFGIAGIGAGDRIRGGTSGWAEGDQFTALNKSSDNFAARLVIFMVLLSWKKAWTFIWNGTPTVNLADPIERLFVECKRFADIPNLLSEINAGRGGFFLSFYPTIKKSRPIGNVSRSLLARKEPGILWGFILVIFGSHSTKKSYS